MSNVRADGKAVWNWFNHDPYNHMGTSIIDGRDSKHRAYAIEHVRVGDEVQGWIGVINRPIRPLPMFPPLRSSRWADLWRWVHDGMRLS